MKADTGSIFLNNDIDNSYRIDNGLLDRPLIIASNRAPVTFSTNSDGSLAIQRGSGGLVTALTGIACQLDATWIACARTREDAAFQSGQVSLKESELYMQVKFLTPDKDAYEGYYSNISNPLLWFLQHSMWDMPRTPIIDRKTWQAWENGYKSVNQLFAQTIASNLNEKNRLPLVMLQDYHLYLVARYLRELLRPGKRPPVLHFVHIPWPGPEYWRILPPVMRYEILNGLCAVDLLGFQTMGDGLNFIRTCESHLPRAYVNFRQRRIWYRNHATYVRDFPISIDVDSIKRLALSQPVEGFCKEIKDIIGDRQLILRIDRIEPSKNILRGFQAYEDLLEHHPEFHSRVVFLALLVPSRMETFEYQNYLDELMAIAGRINATFGASDWEPVRLLVGESYHRAIAAMKMYDVLLVNAIADGMNLVAKEGPVVNQRDGVLILSESAGARQQLEPGALIVSPCDVFATAQALLQALNMPAKERKTRADRLDRMIQQEDIDVWLQRQLEAVRELDL